MKIAIYARVSTDMQDPQRQIDDCRTHIGPTDEEVELYVDTGSGAKDERPEFERLQDDIENQTVSKVVTSEVSRISRLNSTWAGFIDLCMDNEVAVETADGSMLPLDPDNPISKFVAQLMSSIAELEREMIIERVRSGMKRAKREGKWTGRPPKGFSVGKDGYLQVEPEEYSRVVAAMELVEEGESNRAAARHAGIDDGTLHRLYNDPEKRRMYLGADADDPRIASALDESDVEPSSSRLSALEARLSELESTIDQK